MEILYVIVAIVVGLVFVRFVLPLMVEIGSILVVLFVLFLVGAVVLGSCGIGI